MAEAKITIKTLVDNKELQDLNKELANGSQNLKKLQADLKKAEKAHGVASDEAKKLRSELEMQRTTNKALARDINNTSKALTEQSSGMSKLSGIAKQFGLDLDFSMGKMTSIAAAAVAVGGAMVASAREVSALSNQFISFAGNAKQAEQMYNRFNDVYRNTNYDEQKVYDMAKALMRIGVSANESAELIEKVSDASAKLGQGVEFTEQLTQAMAKLKVGGELSQEQLVELAKAGIDLTDVQEQMKKGGVEAYEALKGKLDQYKGGMAETKQTAAEMEGDIKGNLVEIGRQTALLVDDFFGFSDMLKTFYQWVIDVSQTVIDKIKAMRNALTQNIAAADEYGRALQEWEEVYGDSFQGNDTERAAAAAAYANACADIAKEKAEEAQAEEKLLALEKSRAQVKAVTGGSTSSGGGGGSSHSATTATKEVDPIAEAIKEYQAKRQMEEDFLAYKLDNKLIEQEYYNQALEEQRTTYNDHLQQLLEMDGIQEEQKYMIYKAWASKKMEVEKQQTSEISAFNQRIASSFSSAMTDCIMGAKSFGDAFKEILKQLLQQLIQCAMYSLIISSMMPGGVGANFGKVFKGGMGFASGGPVSGPGTSTSDSIPARLSAGEYVLNAKAVEAIGVDNLNRVNFGSRNFAEGGSVGGAGNNITLNVSAMDADSFSDFLGRGGLTSIKEAMFADDLNFAGV